MIKRYEWIETDRPFFGQPNGLYDFEQHNPADVKNKLKHLEEVKTKLSRAVNSRAVNLLGKEEDQVWGLPFSRTLHEGKEKKSEWVI